MTYNEKVLLKELKAARLAIRKMKAECNEHDEGFAIGKAALKRINSTLNEFRQPVALVLYPANRTEAAKASVLHRVVEAAGRETFEKGVSDD